MRARQETNKGKIEQYRHIIDPRKGDSTPHNLIMTPAKRNPMYEELAKDNDYGCLEWIAPGDLHVDEDYQRPLDDHRVSKIARNWQWAAVKPITVGIRVGHLKPDTLDYWVIDGQHQVEAAKRRGDIGRLPCWVIINTDQQSEAWMFLNVNRYRKNVTPYEKHQAALIAREEIALAVRAACDRHGVTVVRNASSSRYDTQAIQALRKVEEKNQQIGGLDAVLNVLTSCWRGEPESLRTVTINAVTSIMHHTSGEIPVEDLIANLKHSDIQKISNTVRSKHAANARLNLKQYMMMSLALEYDRKAKGKGPVLTQIIAQYT